MERKGHGVHILPQGPCRVQTGQRPRGQTSPHGHHNRQGTKNPPQDAGKQATDKGKDKTVCGMVVQDIGRYSALMHSPLAVWRIGGICGHRGYRRIQSLQLEEGLAEGAGRQRQVVQGVHVPEMASRKGKGRRGRVGEVDNTAPGDTHFPPQHNTLGTYWEMKGSGSSSPLPSSPVHSGKGAKGSKGSSMHMRTGHEAAGATDKDGDMCMKSTA